MLDHVTFAFSHFAFRIFEMPKSDSGPTEYRANDYVGLYATGFRDHDKAKPHSEMTPVKKNPMFIKLTLQNIVERCRTCVMFKTFNFTFFGIVKYTAVRVAVYYCLLRLV